MSPTPTRRALLGRGLRLGGLAVAGAGGTALLGAGPALGQAWGDEALLVPLIRLERLAVLAYERLSANRAASATLRGQAETLRDQDQNHADRLIAALAALGGRAPAKPTLAEAHGLTGEKRLLELAVGLEEMTVNLYYRAQRELRDAKLLQATATIMGSDGQHLVVLRQALHRNPVPRALETGAA
jgi:rubrerythrin